MQDITHERDGFGAAVKAEHLPGLTLTRDVFDEALDRCPGLLDEFVSQANHCAIERNVVTHDMGRQPSGNSPKKTRRAASPLPDDDDDPWNVRLPDDQLVDCHGHIRPKGQCRNSLINWSNRPVVDKSDLF